MNPFNTKIILNSHIPLVSITNFQTAEFVSLKWSEPFLPLFNQLTSSVHQEVVEGQNSITLFALKVILKKTSIPLVLWYLTKVTKPVIQRNMLFLAYTDFFLFTA